MTSQSLTALVVLVDQNNQYSSALLCLGFVWHLFCLETNKHQNLMRRPMWPVDLWYQDLLTEYHNLVSRFRLFGLAALVAPKVLKILEWIVWSLVVAHSRQLNGPAVVILACCALGPGFQLKLTFISRNLTGCRLHVTCSTSSSRHSEWRRTAAASAKCGAN